jgi:hypothetical protein
MSNSRDPRKRQHAARKKFQLDDDFVFLVVCIRCLVEPHRVLLVRSSDAHLAAELQAMCDVAQAEFEHLNQ